MAPWRRSGRILAGAVLGLGLAEAAARILIGPPMLYQTDPVYYSRRPGQDHRRFSHRISAPITGSRMTSSSHPTAVPCALRREKMRSAMPSRMQR